MSAIDKQRISAVMGEDCGGHHDLAYVVDPPNGAQLMTAMSSELPVTCAPEKRDC
jgi:hypothetical protein